jgi:hypothetical protein
MHHERSNWHTGNRQDADLRGNFGVIVKLIALLVVIAALFGAGAFVGYSYSQKKVLTVAISALQHDAGKVEEVEAKDKPRQVKVIERIKVIRETIDDCRARTAPAAVRDGL